VLSWTRILFSISSRQHRSYQRLLPISSSIIHLPTRLGFVFEPKADGEEIKITLFTFPSLEPVSPPVSLPQIERKRGGTKVKHKKELASKGWASREKRNTRMAVRVSESVATGASKTDTTDKSCKVQFFYSFM
jgi:hypothetical protein